MVWLGERHIDLLRHPDPASVSPVRIHADAFGPGMPNRDLMISPDHAIFYGGALIPARLLVNETTITRDTAMSSVRYYHVELERHDVLLAENLPCESYLDTGNRSAFANAGAAVQAHPDFAADRSRATACAPLVTEGPILARARAALQDRHSGLDIASRTLRCEVAA